MNKINVGVIGVGNCASSLIQGLEYYRQHDPEEAIGLMHKILGGWSPQDIEIVAAFDIDKRKVGKKVSEAIFEKPNCTTIFQKNIPESNVVVNMGKILDGYGEIMDTYPDDLAFRKSDKPEPDFKDVVKVLKDANVDVLLNYLPVGSEDATKFYMECALEAGAGVVNCIPVFIASNTDWAQKFEDKNLPIIGDDIKAQFGATIMHRSLMETMKKRGVIIDKSYQLNTGGNTDFLNMLERNRLASKKISKTDAVQSIADIKNSEQNLHVGPSDFVPWQEDNKICFVRVEARQFGDIPLTMDIRLSVEDSPNSAGIVIDAIRCCKLALDNKVGGVLDAPSSYFCKHPRKQIFDSEAFDNVEEFISMNAK